MCDRTDEERYLNRYVSDDDFVSIEVESGPEVVIRAAHITELNGPFGEMQAKAFVRNDENGRPQGRATALPLTDRGYEALKYALTNGESIILDAPRPHVKVEAGKVDEGLVAQWRTAQAASKLNGGFKMAQAQPDADSDIPLVDYMEQRDREDREAAAKAAAGTPQED